MQRGSLIAVAVATSLIPWASFAAEETGTGGTPHERITKLRTQVETRIPASTGALLPDAAKQKAWDAERKRHEERLWSMRAKCREELRKANRDTIAAKAQQCYRSDLMEELSLRRKELQFVAALPAVDPAFAAAYREATEALMDAQSAVVDGIDTNVYASVEALEKAKLKLRDQYRVPYWTALFRLSADRLVPWAAWQVDRMDRLLSGEPETEAGMVVGCLEEAVNSAFLARSSAFEGALVDLKKATAASRDCAAILLDFVQGEGPLPGESF